RGHVAGPRSRGDQPRKAHRAERRIHAARRPGRAAHRAPGAPASRNADPRPLASGGDVVAAPTRDELFAILDAVKDPEVPVLSVVELGIVRDAVADDSGVTITITPTYSGCPAMRTIEEDR